MPAGRPTKYRQEFCDEAIDFMSHGYSCKALAGHLRVSLPTLYRWAEMHPEFSEALKTGQALAAKWWERTLAQVAVTGDGSASAAIFGVKNRSQEEWRDKIEQDHTSSDGSMTPRSAIDASKLSDQALQELLEARDQGSEEDK